MTDTPTPLDGLLAALDDYLETNSADPVSLSQATARDRVIAARAVYDYTLKHPPFDQPVNATISHDILGGLTDLLTEARRATAEGVVTKVEFAGIVNEMRETLKRLADVLPHELARGEGESLR